VGNIDPTPPGAAAPLAPVSMTWTPPCAGTWCLLVSVSAVGDRSNIDPEVPFACAAGPTPLWRLVPFDNNLAARLVVAAPSPL
jgi:hypothetical protein